jgi:flagellar biosynthesis protein FlhB
MLWGPGPRRFAPRCSRWSKFRCAVFVARVRFGALLTPLLLTSAGLLLLLGGLDIGLQHWLFRREVRMTKSEQKRERKESLGDPTIKRWRRQDQRAHAAKTGLRNATFLIRSADTVLAMRYAAPDAMVPILVARGTLDGATALLEHAKTLNLPVVFDAATVAMIGQRLKVGRMIAPDMFRPLISCMHGRGALNATLGDYFQYLAAVLIDGARALDDIISHDSTELTCFP